MFYICNVERWSTESIIWDEYILKRRLLTLWLTTRISQIPPQVMRSRSRCLRIVVNCLHTSSSQWRLYRVFVYICVGLCTLLVQTWGACESFGCQDEQSDVRLPRFFLCISPLPTLMNSAYKGVGARNCLNNYEKEISKEGIFQKLLCRICKARYRRNNPCSPQRKMRWHYQESHHLLPSPPFRVDGEGWLICVK